MIELDIDGIKVNITNPDKVLWPGLGIRKIDYIKTMTRLGPYILPHSRDKMLTCVRYPDGIQGKYFFQKNAPDYTPEWVNTVEYNGINYILPDSLATLIWLSNQAALEFHTSFNSYKKPDNPENIVIDLDPSVGQKFDDIAEGALIIHNTLKSLKIESWIKTSGATGLQIYIPTGGRYSYNTARKINEFFGRYFAAEYPERFSVERMANKRSSKLYFDYLQMWYGKTIAMVYTPRANEYGAVSMPVSWDELSKGIKPENFNLLNAYKRLEEAGDIFMPLLMPEHVQNLDHIVEHITRL